MKNFEPQKARQTSLLGDADHHTRAALQKQLWPAPHSRFPFTGAPQREGIRYISPQPSRHVRRKGAAPLSGAEEQTARVISAYAQNV